MEMEAASTSAAGATKRSLELARPEFMAREDGAYHVLEMPKRYKCGYTAKPRRARSHLLSENAIDAKVDKESKRALELKEPEFVMEENGAYGIVEMPKKFKCGFMADPERSCDPVVGAVDAEDARLIAAHLRLMSKSNEYKQELKAMAATRRH